MSPSQSRTIRVFLSSTFRDFAEERDLLVRKVFPELRRKCRERQVELVDVDLRWGITEKEAQQGRVLPICLAEVDRSRPWFMGFIGERYGWVPAPEQFDPAIVQEQPWLEEHRGGKSVTELEILHGVLNNPEMAGRAFFYFRDSKWSKKRGGSYLSEGGEEKAKLEGLKERIRQSGFPVLENYPSPEALAERVKEDLWKLIDEAYPESEVPDALTRERMTHEAYAATRCRLYLGGEPYFAALDEAMKAKSFRPMLITGQSGGGKSALLANWVRRWSPRHPKTAVIVHHLGCGADAADPVRMAVRLMREIAKLTGDEFKPESDPEKQLEQLPLWLSMASAWAQRTKRELLIVLDGLDKVSNRKHLCWFPGFLPPKLKLVVSCLHGEILEAAKGRLAWHDLKVKPFTKVEQKSFIGEYLGRYRKALTAKQIKTLQCHPLSGNPLFLLTVLEELRVFGVHEELEQRLKALLSPPPSKAKGEAPTVDDVFEHVLARVEADIGRKAVQQAMEAIWASRAGLFQDELLAIAKLAPARWAQIQNALDESLYESSGKITFGHDYLRKAVEDRYGLKGKRKLKLHRRLADWFAEREVDERVAAELPWQWREAEDKNELVKCLLTQEAFDQSYRKDKYELLGYWLWTRADIEAAHKRAWEIWLEGLNEEDAAKRASQLGGFLSAAGLYGTFTEAMYRQALKGWEQVFGAEHSETLRSISLLGILLWRKGDYAEAEAMYRRALVGREKVLGAEHADTLSSTHNLGNLLETKGDYKGAEVLIRRALEGYEKALGAEHPHTLTSTNNLGSLLATKGDYKGAEVLVHRALEGRKRVLGAEHPHTLTSTNNLGSLLATKGDYKGAEVLVHRTLESREKVLGVAHPDTLSSVNSLGILLSNQGDYKGAEVLFRRVLEGYEKALGAEHPDTLLSVNRLGEVLLNQGDYKGAEVLIRRALEGYEKALGAEHPHTLSSVNDLGRLLSNQGDYKGAEVLFRRTLESREKVLGAAHHDTLSSVNSLGILLSNQGDYKGAEVLFRRVLEGYEKALGAEHPDTLLSVNRLGEVLLNQGDYKGAEVLIRRALEGYEKALGAEHPDTLGSVNNLGRLLGSKGDYKGAESLLRQALKGYENVLGKEHPDTLRSVNNLGNLLDDKGDYTRAEALYRRAIKGREKVLGKEHSDTLDAGNCLANCLCNEGRFEEAEALNRKLLEAWKNSRGEYHPSTLRTLFNLALCREDQNDYIEAESLHRQALAGYERSEGKFGTRVLESLEVLGQLLVRACNYQSAEKITEDFLQRAKQARVNPGKVAAAYVRLGISRKAQRRIEEAICSFKEAVQFAQQNEVPRIWRRIADCYFELGKMESIVEPLEKALKLWESLAGPASTEALGCLSDLCDVLHRVGKSQLGLERLRKASEIDGSGEWVDYNLAMLELAAGNIEKSKDILTRHLRQFPQFKERALNDPDLATLYEFITTMP